MKHTSRWINLEQIAGKIVVLALLFAVCAQPVLGQKIEVQPQDGMMDERLVIKLTALKPGQAVIIRATTQDADGKLWQSFAGFYADDKGEVNLATQAPANGTYTGVDAMGLIRSMDLAGEAYGRGRFALKRADPLTFKFTLEIEGRSIASAEVSRRFRQPDARMIDLRADGLVGTLFSPPGEGPFPAVLVLGGSEGGLNSEDVAALLSSHGYAALALAYFGAEGLPNSLEEIPLEYFKRAIDWLLTQRFVRSGGLALLGTSKGAEAALLLGAHYKEVRAVVGYVPSGVVWSCICAAPNKSSWAYNGKPVPFIPQAADPTYAPPRGFPVKPAVNYLYRLRNQAAVQQAVIPVEQINGPVLLISGKDDQLWPSFTLAEMVLARLKRQRRPFADKHLAFASAGHLIGKAYLPAGSTMIAGGRLMTGGTPEANAKAQEESWPEVLKFLNSAFSQR